MPENLNRNVSGTLDKDVSKDVRLGLPRNDQIECLGNVLVTLNGEVLRASWDQYLLVGSVVLKFVRTWNLFIYLFFEIETTVQLFSFSI